MADKGLSPRQKMINLMYLVLTALLALNVSAEILNAFILIDQSIQKSTVNVNTKNGEAYGVFIALNQENPKKVEGWYDKAMELKAKSDELTEKIQEYKQLLVTTADGPEGDVNHIQKKDDNNVGGQVMITEKNGELLKEQLEEYREFVLGLIDEADKDSSILVSNIETTLTTEDVESLSEPGKMLPWAEANFEHLPLIAVIAMMSKMQNDVRNVESDVLSYMKNKIGETDFRFNKIQAIVNAPVSYVRIGEEFSADVFIAAADTTQDLKIELTEGGGKMVIDTVTGRGIYTGNTGSPGTFKWGGNIILTDPGTKEEKKYPFMNEYQVVSPTFAVAADKMNVFYIGVKNPVTITGTGKSITASISGAGGRLTSTGNGKYDVTVTSRGDANVTVTADGRQMGTVKFRCLPVPDPYATVAGMKGGVIAKQTLLAQSIVRAQLDNFVFDLSFPVTGFTVSATINGFTEEAKSTNASITSQQRAIITQLNRGQKVYFENITARAPDGTIRNLGSISFKLQ
ncbi:MAG: gliding motility protein GldM [Bacteroidales bacterium]|nr:gliding motility protein GldM [Bacteroidales bacterium]